MPGISNRGKVARFSRGMTVFDDLVPTGKTIVAGLAAAAALALTACAEGRGGPIPYDIALPAPDSATVVPLEQGYRIAPLDKLEIKVLRMADLTGDYNVDLAGNISVPLIGEVRAVNLTTAELDRQLTAKLGETYLENP